MNPIESLRRAEIRRRAMYWAAQLKAERIQYGEPVGGIVDEIDMVTAWAFVVGQADEHMGRRAA